LEASLEEIEANPELKSISENQEGAVMIGATED
jgi:hypothetical protein